MNIAHSNNFQDSIIRNYSYTLPIPLVNWTIFLSLFSWSLLTRRPTHQRKRLLIKTADRNNCELNYYWKWTPWIPWARLLLMNVNNHWLQAHIKLPRVISICVLSPQPRLPVTDGTVFWDEVMSGHLPASGTPSPASWNTWIHRTVATSYRGSSYLPTGSLGEMQRKQGSSF